MNGWHLNQKNKGGGGGGIKKLRGRRVMYKSNSILKVFVTEDEEGRTLKSVVLQKLFY